MSNENAIFSSTSAPQVGLSGTPNLVHQLPIKLNSSNFILWKTQIMPMLRGCRLAHHVDGSKSPPEKVLANNNPNPEFVVWEQQDHLVLSWIVASVSESVLPQIVGAERAREAWTKLVTAYASGSRPQIREL